MKILVRGASSDFLNGLTAALSRLADVSRETSDPPGNFDLVLGIAPARRTDGVPFVAYVPLGSVSSPVADLVLSAEPQAGAVCVGFGLDAAFLGGSFSPRRDPAMVFVRCASTERMAETLRLTSRLRPDLVFSLSSGSAAVKAAISGAGIGCRVRYETRALPPVEEARLLGVHAGVLTDEAHLAAKATALGVPVVLLGRSLPALGVPSAEDPESAARLLRFIDGPEARDRAATDGSRVRSWAKWPAVAGRVLDALRDGPWTPISPAAPEASSLTSRRPRIALLHDGATWAFSRIAGQIAERLRPWADVRIGSAAALPEVRDLDAVVAIWWKTAHLVSGLPSSAKLYPCVYDFFTWTDPRQREHLKAVAERSGGLLLASCDLLADRFRRERLAREVLTLTDGVDAAMFPFRPRPADDGKRDLVVGWAGNPSRHGTLKGLGLIRTAAAAVPGISLREANALQAPVPFDRMPEWYAGLDALVVASESEGTPNPVLEAMATGRVVLSTKVGVVPMMRSRGVRTIQERSAGGIEAAFRDLLRARESLDALGMENRREAEERWTWDVRLEPLVSRLRTDLQSLPDRPSLVPAPRAEEDQRSLPRVLLVSDVRGWAFDQNLRDLAAHLGDRFRFEFWYIRDYLDHGTVPEMSRFNAVFTPYHRWNVDRLLPWDRLLGSLRAAFFRPEVPGPPTAEDVALVNRFRAFHTVNRVNQDQLRERCPRAVYLTNPVDVRRFEAPAEDRTDLVAVWNGNARHINGAGVDVKGLHPIVVPACKEAGVRLELAEFHTCRLPPSEMPAFYRRGTVAVCASLYEGASNSVMEAMASGLAVVATDVGNHREMQESQRENLGGSGIILVERSVSAISAALSRLREDPAEVRRMGALNRAEIATRWSWEAWADRYAQFIRMAL